MPTTQIDLFNPKLWEPAFDYGSVTERVCAPRKYACLPDDCGDNPCQGCNGEPNFTFVVEPNDTIPLQFRVPDYINDDPLHPTIGWRGASGSYWVGLEVWSANDTLLWEGNTALIAQGFHVGVGEFGGYQNILVDVSKLLQQVPGLTCWYFRLKVYTQKPEYGVANSDSLPDHLVPVGYRYINFMDGNVYEWSGTTWVVVGPHPERYWYVQETGQWYQYVMPGGYWQGLLGPPSSDPAFEAFDYCYTMFYRMRRCDEPILHYQCELTGRDCIGYIHDVGEFTLGAGAIVPFQHDFKVRGSVEVDERPLEKEYTKNKRLIKVVQSTRARMRTWGVPDRIVQRIQVVLASEGFTLNGEQWQDVDGLKKNNDDGVLWYLDSKLSREECDTTIGCD